MFGKKKPLIIAAIILALAFTLIACQRLNGKTEDVISEDEENQQGDKGDEMDKPQITDEPKEKDDSLIPVAQNNGFDVTYGYKDRSGTIVIQPRFKTVEPFFESGVALVYDLTEKAGLIDKTGTYIVEPHWDYLMYNEELFIGYQYENNISAVFDKTGKMVFQREGYIADYSEGLSSIYSETEKGYLDKTGNIAIKLDYDVLDFFKDGIAEVAPIYMGPSHYIDKSGNDLTDKVSSGLRMYQDEKTSLFGFKNQQGDIVINAQYYEVSPFLNGYAFVNVASDLYNGRYGVIDTTGKEVLEPKYCGIVRLKNGLVAVGEEISAEGYFPYEYFNYCKKALFTSDFKKSTEYIYYLVANFDNENVCVNDDKSVYFINKDLNQSEELPKISGKGQFIKDEELLRGYYNGKLTIFDAKGKLLVQDSGDIDLGAGITSQKKVDLPTPVTSFRYPVISGLTDKTTEGLINDVIYSEMVEPYEEFVRFDNPDDITYLDSNYVITKEKNLILIDQTIYTYLLGAAHGYSYRNTVYIDSKTGVKYGLADLFKTDSDVWEYLSQAVTGQIQEKMEEMGYFEDGVEISTDTPFAIKKDGLVIYYAEGEIASYAAGMQEFFVPFSDLNEYIDTQSGFWQAFK